MKTKLLHEAAQRTFAVVFDPDDDPVKGLKAFAAEQSLLASSFTAIGAFRNVTLGYFNWETKQYDKIPIDDQVEVLALIGNITRKGNEPKIHAHVVVGKRDGTAHGGHLLEARVRPTLEVVVRESPEFLIRVSDEITGLPLIAIR
ncbi:MAG TPA: PPC domain-containing DNA-binding protein [Lacipirellulaceae bacterium]|nr:PPC domain-containing DNA-binding protein [Lacipirellulaceae bacterium]